VCFLFKFGRKKKRYRKPDDEKKVAPPPPPPPPPKPLSDVDDDEEEEDDDDVDVSKYKLDSDEVMNNLQPFINYFTCLVCNIHETINSLT